MQLKEQRLVDHRPKADQRQRRNHTNGNGPVHEHAVSVVVDGIRTPFCKWNTRSRRSAPTNWGASR